MKIILHMKLKKYFPTSWQIYNKLNKFSISYITSVRYPNIYFPVVYPKTFYIGFLNDLFFNKLKEAIVKFENGNSDSRNFETQDATETLEETNNRYQPDWDKIGYTLIKQKTGIILQLSGNSGFTLVIDTPNNKLYLKKIEEFLAKYTKVLEGITLNL